MIPKKKSQKGIARQSNFFLPAVWESKSPKKWTMAKHSKAKGGKPKNPRTGISKSLMSPTQGTV